MGIEDDIEVWDETDIGVARITEYEITGIRLQRRGQQVVEHRYNKKFPI